MPPSARIAEFPQTAAEQARWWERHILEVLDGLPPDAPEGTVPRPEFDPERNSLAQQERAKVAELIFKPSPESIAEITSLLAPGGSRS
ncbi:hypothetical protein ACFWOJ_10205 [Streptomyces sp. NPDC058439]|uniref:hypothetical protein n=1 Tax=Streptomyces sp. NPDC058439 TaxID=3346500 RepID=UPI0036586BB9